MSKRFIAHNADFGNLNIVPYHAVIMGKCRACGSMREIDRDVLADKAGAQVWLDDAAKRLKCSECGAKDGKIVTGYYAMEWPERITQA